MTNFFTMIRKRVFERQNTATVVQGSQDSELLTGADLVQASPIIDDRTPPCQQPEDLDFDEEWYLRRYPGVALAVKEGKFASGFKHYELHGRSEGRLPKHPAAPTNDSFFTPDNAALMKRFCSLGVNCELGIAQRHCGAEPIDLLRWAATPLPVLLHLLDERFEGIADGIEIQTIERGEYMVFSRKYHFAWHSWVNDSEMPPEHVYEREIKRLPRVAEFFIETLTDASRIFVRTPRIGETQSDATKIVSAIKHYGPGELLFIERDPTQVGVVRRLEDGLLFACIDEFASRANVPQTIHIESWLAICRNTALVVAEGRGASCLEPYERHGRNEGRLPTPDVQSLDATGVRDRPAGPRPGPSC